jgi:hypothetical protein
VNDTSTIRTGSGDPTACTFSCLQMPRPCMDGDGFCPAGCTRPLDRDCRQPEGQACQNNGECRSTVCEDGFCCLRRCDRCEACLGPGGSCSPITNGVDPGQCDNMKMCNNVGTCVNRSAGGR